jgi:hypothetical protein
MKLPVVVRGGKAEDSVGGLSFGLREQFAIFT